MISSSGASATRLKHVIQFETMFPFGKEVLRNRSSSTEACRWASSPAKARSNSSLLIFSLRRYSVSVPCLRVSFPCGSWKVTGSSTPRRKCLAEPPLDGSCLYLRVLSALTNRFHFSCVGNNILDAGIYEGGDSEDEGDRAKSGVYPLPTEGENGLCSDISLICWREPSWLYPKRWDRIGLASFLQSWSFSSERRLVFGSSGGTR
jgi:hypothetical protein